MAASSVLGGIGQGLMQGVGFIQQRRQMDENKALREQQLEMQRQQLQMNQDLHNERMGQLNIAADERKRVDALGKLRMGIEENYADLPDYQREQMFIDNGLKTSLIKPDELAAAKKGYDGMVKVAGADAFDAAVQRGDVEPLRQVFKSKGLGDVSLDGNEFVITTGGKSSRIDRRGLMQMSLMSGAYERELQRQKAAAEAMKGQAEVSKTLAETNRANADADLKRATAAGKNPVTIDDNGNTVPNPLYAGGSRKRAGASGAGSDGAGGGTYEALGFKNQGEMQKWIGEALPDGGDMRDAEGRAVSVPRDQLLRSTETNLDLLLRANTGIAAPVARDIAVSMALTRLGAPAGDGIYVPTPQLNAETGDWETVVRTGDKIVARVPSAVIEPTPEQVFEQESRYAERLSDQIGVELTEIAKNPKGREALSLAMRSPGAMAALEQKLGVPNLGRKLEVLYAYTGLGGAVLPDQRLNAKRAEVLREREAAVKKSASASSAPSFSQIWDELTKTAGQAASMRAGAVQ